MLNHIHHKRKRRKPWTFSEFDLRNRENRWETNNEEDSMDEVPNDQDDDLSFNEAEFQPTHIDMPSSPFAVDNLIDGEEFESECENELMENDKEVNENPKFVNDALWYCLSRKIFDNLTNESLKKLLIDVHSLSSSKNAVLSLDDFLQFEDGLKANVTCLKKFRCSCGVYLMDAESTCPSYLCQRSVGKRSSKEEVSCIAVFSLRTQLISTVTRCFSDILRCHQIFHNNQFQEDTYLASEHFKKGVENLQDFQQNLLNVNLCINTDGFCPKTNASRGNLWPFYCSVLDLPASQRFSLKRMMISSVFHGPKKPNGTDFSYFWKYIKSELNDPLPIYFGGIQYLLNVQVRMVLADNEAIKLMFNVPSYDTGVCIYCHSIGIYKNHAYRFKNLLNNEKSSDYYDINGSGAATGVCSLDNVCIDWLHNWMEGLCKIILNGLITTTTQFADIKLNTHVQQELDNVVCQTLLPTAFNGRLITFTKFSELCGRDVDLLVMVFVPVVILCGHLANPTKGVYLLILITIRSALLRTDLDDGDLILLCEAQDALAVLWDTVFGLESQTYKTHVYLTHLSSAIRKFNNTSDLDTCCYEHANLYMKEAVGLHVTRNFDQRAVQKFMLTHQIEQELLERAPTTDIVGIKYMLKLREKNRNIIHDGFMSNKQAKVPTDASSDEFMCYQLLVAELGPTLTLRSRITHGGLTISSPFHWIACKKTQQSNFFVRIRDRVSFFKVVLIGKNDSNLLLVGKLFDTVSKNNDRFSALLSLQDHSAISSLTKLFDILIPKFGNYLQLSSTYSLCCVSPNAIVAHAVEIVLYDSAYAVRLPSKKRFL